MQSIALLGVLQHTRVGLTEHRLVEALAEALGSLGHLLIDFLVKLRDFILDKHIGAIALLGVLVVNQRVIEGIDVA